jgi:L-malate glycosyltransferase
VTILHISTAQSWRGGEQQLANLIAANNERCQNIVFCVSSSAIENYCRLNKVQHLSFSKKWLGRYRASANLSKLCIKLHVSLIHCHDSHAHTMAIISSSFFGNKCPVVAHRRVDFPIGKGYFSRFKYNHPSVAAYICVSHAIRNILLLSLKRPELAVTIYSSIDIERFKSTANTRVNLKQELKLPPGAKLIGNTAALAPHKDYATFVKTAALLVRKQPDWYYVIIGEGSERTAIENEIAIEKLENHFFMTGFRNDVPQLLGSLDAFLMTSKTEGLGTSILGSFVAGVPVVATKAGGIPELVVDGQSGLLAEAGDAQGLANQLEKVLTDHDLKVRIVENAAKRAKQFDSHTMALETYKTYEKVLNEFDLNE